MTLYELFEQATGGYPLDETDLGFLQMYVTIGDEGDIMFLIEQMSETYDDPELAEVGFIVVWDAIVKSKK
jgi:hypothetical protein